MPIILTMPTITFESKGWTPCKTNLRSRSWRLHASTKCALERDPDQGGFLRLTLPEGHNVLKLNRATATRIRDVNTNNLEKDAPVQDDQPPHGMDPT